MPNFTLTAERSLTLPRPGVLNRLRAMVGRPVHTFTPNIYAEAMVHAVEGRGLPTLHIDGADHRGRVKVRLAVPDGVQCVVQRVTVRERGAAFVSYPHAFRVQNSGPAANRPGILSELKSGEPLPDLGAPKVVSHLRVNIDASEFKEAAEEAAAQIRAEAAAALAPHWVQRRKLWDTVSSPITEDLLWLEDALEHGDMDTVSDAVRVIRAKVDFVAEAAQDAAMAVDAISDSISWTHDGRGVLSATVPKAERLKRNLNQSAAMVRAILDRAHTRPRVVRTKGV